MGESGSFGSATEPGSAREEAERLVAAALAMARSATISARHRAGAFGPFGQVIADVLDQARVVPAPERPEPAGGPPGADPGPRCEMPGEAPAQASRSAGESPLGAGFATGDPECCVCPVCRSIAALRDPSPEFAERLATGAGDFAAGVASLLRAISAVTSATGSRSGSGAGDDSAGSATDSRTAGGSAGADPGARAGAGPDGAGTPAAPPTGRCSEWGDTVWREATRTRHDSGPVDEPDDIWAVATRAEAGTPETEASPAPAGPDDVRPTESSATGRPPGPGARTPEGPVAASPGEQAAPEGA